MRGRRTSIWILAVIATFAGACSSDDGAGAPTEVPATTDPGDVEPGPAEPNTAGPGTTSPGATSPGIAAPAIDDPSDDLAVLPGDRPDATGDGVVVVIIDSGVDWRHPDLRRADGSTRLAAIVDLSGQTAGCAPGRPAPTVYLADEIDRALDRTDRADAADDLGHVDAVGRGTALAGLAAGNGAASQGRLAGVAFDASIIAVKQVSEGVPPGALGPGGPPVAGCLDDALDEVDALLERLDRPAVLLAPTGAQWGPLDGTSAASRRLERSFGPDTPGRVLVTGAGDEGGRPNHARVQVTATDPTAIVPFERPRTERSNPTLWYGGDQGLLVSVRLDDGTLVGPVGPGEAASVDGVEIVHYEPGTEFHPWTSTGGDHAVWMLIDRAAGRGEIVLERPDGAADGAALIDVFGDLFGPEPGASSIEFTHHLAAARVTDAASTPGAVVVTAHVARTGWVDVRGRSVEPAPFVAAGEPWPAASSGPTRDGRQVVAVSAPGQHAIGPLAAGSLLAERDELHPAIPGGDPDARSVVVTGTGPAAAIVVGVVAAMLEIAPGLTAAEVGALLVDTAVAGRVDAVAAVAAARTASP